MHLKRCQHKKITTPALLSFEYNAVPDVEKTDGEKMDNLNHQGWTRLFLPKKMKNESCCGAVFKNLYKSWRGL